MSLRKQLFLAICLFLLVAFSGSFFVSLESSREQMLGQLRSHAQDAATALGLSLTAQIDDPAMIQLMVSSIFDSGYFSSIRIIDIENEQVLVERSASGIGRGRSRLVCQSGQPASTGGRRTDHARLGTGRARRSAEQSAVRPDQTLGQHTGQPDLVVVVRIAQRGVRWLVVAPAISSARGHGQTGRSHQ